MNLRWAAVFVLLIAMAGCGSKHSDSSAMSTTTSSPGATPVTSSSTTVATATDKPDPCSVFTKAEAQAIVGNGVIGAKPTGGGDGCYFAGVAGGSSLLVNLEQKDSQAKFDDARKNAQLQTPKVSIVSGIGDEAFTYAPADGGIASAEARLASLRVRIVITGANATAAQAKDALTTAVSRLSHS